MRKVITIGELLIDFMPMEKGFRLKDTEGFVKKPGGAPANVAVAAAKLGRDAYFIGQVGQDGFGDFLKSSLEAYGVNTSRLYQTSKAKTALAFVSLDDRGERDFIFYRNPSADQLLEKDGINLDDFKNEILHFCSVSLDDYPIKETHKYVIRTLKQKGTIISFDPNLRFSLFSDLMAYRKNILEFIPYADILKISEDELEFITTFKDEKKAVEMLLKFPLKYLIITRGSEGASLFTKSKRYDVGGVEVDAIDMTGAGDAFIGAFLAKIALDEITDKNEDEKIIEYLNFANKVAALTTTKLGAMNAIPYLDEINI